MCGKFQFPDLLLTTSWGTLNTATAVTEHFDFNTKISDDSTKHYL